ncbi:MAG: flavin reductase [Nocardioides sp.]|nr:flavin reductase [Nocardioides sp.]
MTIHDTHPFADAEPDPARRFRGRLGGAVTLWTAGSGAARAGLTVSSVVLARGEPDRLLALVDPDSDLADTLDDTGRAVVHVLAWRHRDLADAFAGVAPSPGGPFRAGTFTDDVHGPRLVDATAVARVAVESTAEVGWSLLVTAMVEDVEVAPGDDGDEAPLLHRRGRYRTIEG